MGNTCGRTRMAKKFAPTELTAAASDTTLPSAQNDQEPCMKQDIDNDCQACTNPSLEETRRIKASSDVAPICWICMEEGTEDNPLRQNCGCSTRTAHRGCIARWQIQSVATSEEKQCRFCQQPLRQHWSEALLPENVEKTAPRALIAVVYGNVRYKIPVAPGPEGEAEFNRTVRQLFNFPEDFDFGVTFKVRLPAGTLPATNSHSSVVLHGIDQYQAAANCAHASAVARHLKQQASAANK